MKRYILAGSALVASFYLAVGLVASAVVLPPGGVPTTAEDCKQDGWRNYGDMFKNQGDCVSFVATDGRNEPDGPPIH
jgi:hypothetical protein